MRKVGNKKFIRRLADKSFRAARTRNIIAVIAIALTSMLFTSLFTIGIGTVETFQQQTMRQAGGDSHGTIKDITREQYDKMSRDPSIKECADNILVADNIRNPEFLKRHMESWYIPEYHYKHWFINILDGRAPVKADEILMDEISMQLMGLEAKPGQQVTLQMQIKQSSDEVVDRTFTVTGITKADPAMNTGFAIVSKEYLIRYAKELANTYAEDSSATGAIQMDVNFSNSFSIQKKLNKIITNAGYSTDENSPDYVGSNANWAYVSDGGSTDPVTAGAVFGGLFIIMLTGYLIIYNIFQISVIRDIQYYGLLKTIGTTGKQIKKILRRQALLLSGIGIPFGLFTGYFIGKAIVPRVISLSGAAGSEVSVSVNPVIFLGAAGFTLLTIWFSTGKPARIAAKVSPVEAVRYTEGSQGKKKQKKSTSGGKLWRMAFSNLGRSKRKTILVLLSLTLAVILLNSVFTITHSFDMNTFLKKFVSSDFQIANAKYFGTDLYWGVSVEGVQEEKLSESFIQACEAQDGFEEGGRLYCATRAVGLKKDSWTLPSYVKTDDAGNPGYYWNGQFQPFEILEDGNYQTAFYGMEDFYYQVLDIWKGETDLAKLKEKMDTGNYIICSVGVDDNNYVDADEVMFQPGDKVTLTYGDGKEREVEVLALVKENSWGMTPRYSNEFNIYVPADVFKTMTSDEYLMCYAFNAADNKEAAIGDFLESYTTQAEPFMHYVSRAYYLEQFSGLTTLFTLIGGILTLIVGVIGILNFVNSILTSIVTRQREFAMLEAVGMTRKQLSKMLMLEGVYYAVATMVSSLILGCVFSVTVIRVLSGGMWFMKYHFVIWPMLATFPVLFLIGLLVPKIALVLEKKKSVVERLRKTEQ